MANGQMIIGVEGNTMPMNYYDEFGELAGFDHEFAKEVCSRLGINPIFKIIDWNEKEKELNDKTIDCVWESFTITEERQKNIKFTYSYLSNKQVVVIKKTDASNYTTLESLKDAKFTAEKDSTGEDSIKSNSQLSQVSYESSPSVEKSFENLKEGKYDALVVDFIIAKSMISTSKYSDLMIIDGINLGNEEYGVGFRKDSNMPEKINKIILDMMEDFTLFDLSQKYDLVELFLPITKTDSKYIIDKKELVIGIVNDRPPMSYYNNTNELIGFDIEFAKAVTEKLGITPIFKNIDWNNKESELKEKNIDCIWSGLTVTKNRRNNMKFSRAYMMNKQSIVVRKEDMDLFTDWESLSKVYVKITAGIDTTGEEIIESHPYLSHANYIPSPTQEQTLSELKKENVDVVVIDYTAALSIINSGELSDLVILENFDLGQEIYAIGFRIGSDMTERVNTIIKELINDNTLSNLAEKYGLKELYDSVELLSEGSDSDYIFSKGEIVIGVRPNNQPFCYVDHGGFFGFDIDYSSNLFRTVGLDVKYTVIDDWDNKEEKLKSKEVDCIWNSVMNVSDRKKDVRYNSLILNYKQAIVIKKEQAQKFPNLESLSNSKIACVKNSGGYKVIKSNSILNNASLTETDSYESLFELLYNETIDAIVVDHSIAKKFIANKIYKNLIIITVIDFADQQYAYSFRQGSDMIRILNLNTKAFIDTNVIDIFAERYNLLSMYSLIDETDLINVIKGDKMIIGIDENHPPMSFRNENGELVGFDIEFAKEICSRLGVEPEFQNIVWEDKENELLLRNIDCIFSGLTVTEKRRQNIKFSGKYAYSKQVVIIRKSDAQKYKDIVSLSKVKLSAEIGSTGEQSILINSFLSGAKYIGSDCIVDAITGLKTKLFDGVVTDYSTAKYIVGKKDYSDLMIVEGIMLNDGEYAIGFRIGSDLTKPVNDIIQNLLKENWFDEVAKKYDFSEFLIKDKKTDSEYIMSNGRMIIGIDGTVMPMNYYNEYGELVGFDFDFATEVCSRLGIDPIFKIIDWGKKEEELNNKNIDCIWESLTITEERRKYMSFTYSYLSNKEVVVIKKSDASKYTTLESLTKAKLTATEGSTCENLIKSNKYLKEADYESSPSIEKTFENLKNGKYDAIVIDYPLAKSTLADDDYADLMIIEGINFGNEEYVVGFRKDSDMKDEVNRIILDMMVDNSLMTLAEKYNLVELYMPVVKTDAKYIMEKKELIIALDTYLPPMTYYDDNGELIGFEIEFTKEICKRLDIKPVFKSIDWNIKDLELNVRNVDCICSSLTVTDQRRKTFKFSRIYMTNKQSIVIRKLDKNRFLTWDDLSAINVKFSAAVDTTGEEAIKTNPYLSQTIYTPSSTQEEALEELKNGTYDAIVIDYTTAKVVLKNDYYSELMIIPNLDLANEVFAIGFRLGSDMTEKVNEKINEMIKDKTLLSIAEKYDLKELYEALETSHGNSDSAYIFNNGEIVIGVKTNNRPFCYEENGALTGFDIDFSSLLFKNAGLDVKYAIIDDWNNKEDKLRSKEVDCIWDSIMNTDDRKKDIRYNSLILNNKQAVVIKRSNSSKYPNLESLSGSKIAYAKESSGEKAVKTEKLLQKASITVANSQEDLLELLENGSNDAIVMDYVKIKSIIAKGNVENLIILEIINMADQQYSYSLRQGSDLIKKINSKTLDFLNSNIIFVIARKYNLESLYSFVDQSDLVNAIGNSKLIIGINENHQPMSYITDKGKLIGFDIDFANEVCSRLGVEAEFQNIIWADKENELTARNIDCIWSGLSVTDDRRKIMKFSSIYLYNEQVVVIRKGDSGKYKNINSLIKAKLSSEIGSTSEQSIKSNLYLTSAKYIGSDNIIDALNGLKDSTFDAVVIDYTVAKTIIGKGDFYDLMIIKDLSVGEEGYAIGFRSDSDLTKKINEIINDLYKEKWLNTTANKYGLAELLREEEIPEEIPEELDVKTNSGALPLKSIKNIYGLINMIIFIFGIVLLNI